jgi:hypothetical protein
MLWRDGLDWLHSRHDPEVGTEPSGFIEDGKFLEKRSDISFSRRNLFHGISWIRTDELEEQWMKQVYVIGYYLTEHHTMKAY